MERLYSDYKNMVGKGIPYWQLGYDSSNNFLKSILYISNNTKNTKGEVMVADKSTQHMQDLLKRSRVGEVQVITVVE